MSYKIFVIEDPLPWLDQLIETTNIMVRRCGGSSTEFVIAQILRNQGHPHHLLLGAVEEGIPDKLAAWLLASFIYDTKAPWVEVWGLWCRPGTGTLMRDLAKDHLMDWCHHLKATRITSILTRSPRVFLKMFHEALGFEQVGIVIQKELRDARS